MFFVFIGGRTYAARTVSNAQRRENDGKSSDKQRLVMLEIENESFNLAKTRRGLYFGRKCLL